MGCIGIGAGERGEHALIFRPRVRRADGKPIEVLHQRGLVIEVLDQAALPRGREVERRDQGRKQRDVAHADVGGAQAVVRRGLEPKREHFGICRRLVGAAEGFDAGLQEFGCTLGAMAEDRTEIAERLRRARGR